MKTLIFAIFATGLFAQAPQPAPHKLTAITLHDCKATDSGYECSATVSAEADPQWLTVQIGKDKVMWRYPKPVEGTTSQGVNRALPPTYPGQPTISFQSPSAPSRERLP